MRGQRGLFDSARGLSRTLAKDATRHSGITTKRQTAMFKHSKVRQAGLILFATTLLLIVPNLTRLFG